MALTEHEQRELREAEQRLDAAERKRRQHHISVRNKYDTLVAELGTARSALITESAFEQALSAAGETEKLASLKDAERDQIAHIEEQMANLITHIGNHQNDVPQAKAAVAALTVRGATLSFNTPFATSGQRSSKTATVTGTAAKHAEVQLEFTNVDDEFRPPLVTGWRYVSEAGAFAFDPVVVGQLTSASGERIAVTVRQRPGGASLTTTEDQRIIG